MPVFKSPLKESDKITSINEIPNPYDRIINNMGDLASALN